jgi:cell division protease FtsH
VASRAIPFIAVVESLSYSEFQTYLKEGRIAEMHVSSEIEGAFKEPLANGMKRFVTNGVEPELAAELSSQKVTFSSERENSWWTSLASWIISIVLIGALWMFVLGRVMQKGGIGGGGFMTIRKSKAKIYMEKDIKFTFADVAGVDEAKTELQEVIEFLETPEKFRRLGGKIPKGILGRSGNSTKRKTARARCLSLIFPVSGSPFPL